MKKSDFISITLFLTLINVNVGQETTDYSFENDYDEEIPKQTSVLNATLIATTTTTEKHFIDLLGDIESNNVFDSDERRKMENDVIKKQLDTMSSNFRKIITKIKMKHKKIDMVFLVDASSSVGKENFENEIGFVKRLLSDFIVSFNYTRVALITFSSRSKIFVHINQISQVSEDNDKCILLNYQIPNITYSGGGTNTFGALLKAKEIFDNSNRKECKKILLLITDGFSNGRSPKPIAEELKSDNITIFTVGISSGNLDELRSICSKPIENYNYMLSSFSIFESLARKALHTDYKVGVILPVSNHTFCDSLCDENGTESCCDVNAECSCGFHTGHYNCMCKRGYYGTGIKSSAGNGCDLCPNGTYWNSYNSCFNCPDINHETRIVPAMSLNDCVCKSGFRETQKHRCEVIKCPPLLTPNNGYFVTATCPNTVNSACGARCKTGYQLTGSSIRLCQEDGTWSGHETECVLKSCPGLQIPFYGVALCRNSDLNITIDYSPRNASFLENYSVDVQKFTDEFPTDTECIFSCAIGFHLIGSKKRHCLPVSKWDGSQTSCKQILCPALPKIPNGSYDSDECFEQKSSFGTNCTVTCDEGFEIKGPSIKNCGSSNSRNGMWSQKSKIPRCVDVTPPNIECPDDYSIELNEKKSFVLLTSFAPMKSYEDNSKGNVTFWVKPALKEEGTKMYAGNYTFTYVAIDEVKNKAKCNFTISIADTTPPIFENCIVNQTFYVSTKNDKKIEWEEPNIYDNVDDKNITIIKNLNHTILSIGEHLVNYTAIDKSGNQNSCLMYITVKEKKCDELEKPENGQRVCAKNDTMTWCDFRCNFGYGMMENETVVENIIMTCDLEKRIWNQDSSPQCTVIEEPNSVEEVLTISLNSENLLCEDFAKNQEELIKQLKEELCGNQECELTTELPECIENDIPNEIDSPSYYSIVKREVSASSLRPIKKSKNPEKVELYVKISKKLGIWKTNLTRSDNIKRVKEELKKVNTSERFKKRLRNMNLDLTTLKLDEIIKCNEGSVSRKLVCVQCAKGTYQDLEQNICIQCPLGTFNNQTGQMSCYSCPQYHSTRKIGSRSSDECREMCKPGFQARLKSPKKSSKISNLKTLMPFCKSCGIGEYQANYDQLFCDLCPDGMTSERGSTSINDCFKRFEESCNEVTCGDHGKCVQSDAFYSCECDEGFYGQNCEITENPCSSSPCFNDGTCQVVNKTHTTCECKSTQYQGDFCESLDDPCNQKNCQNNANCYEDDNEGFCECLDGFEGDLCEKQIQIDFCASSPCLNATCVNKKDDYQCICDEGIIGKRCHLQPCDYSPCPQYSECVNLKTVKASKDNYVCKCFTGLKGKNCDEIDNPCEPNPCHNDAQCIPIILRDLYNITRVDDVNVYKEYTCSCPPYFYGKRCSIFTTPDFVLEFEKSSVNNYVKFDGPKSDFEAISFCTWIQTNDQFNYGSIISYANEVSDNSFTFTDYNGFVLYVNGVNVITDIKIIDNIWHFLCVSWTMEEGMYEIYLDGDLHVQGKNLSKATPIKGKGIFIIGQEQDIIGGGFSETESFVGKISYLDFWNRQLTAIEINEYYRTCDPYQGNFISWTDLKLKTFGNVKVETSEFCKSCQEKLLIDNANVIYGDQSAFVKCNEGFKIEGNPFIFCLRTSKWDLSKFPTCKIVKCENLKTPANGRMSLTKISYKGTAKFTCNDGFRLEGNNTLSCEGTGKWSSEIPECISIFECPALEIPKNGVLIYASDSGIINKNFTSYPLGTFAEIKCNSGYKIENENLISCTDNGIWDFEIEDCVLDVTKIEVPTQFWSDFKEFLFLSCASEKPKLCQVYKSEGFNSDLVNFELPETKEFEGMDVKLLNFLENITENTFINAENFIKILLNERISDQTKVDSYRFVICLYIDLILLDEKLKIVKNAEDENINEKVKRMIKEKVKFIYKNYMDKN